MIHLLHMVTALSATQTALCIVLSIKHKKKEKEMRVRLYVRETVLRNRNYLNLS